MDSLFPRIWAVDAVGMGANNKLFLTPCLKKNKKIHNSISWQITKRLPVNHNVLTMQMQLTYFLCIAAYFLIFSRSEVQSWRSVGVTFHMSCCKIYNSTTLQWFHNSTCTVNQDPKTMHTPLYRCFPCLHFLFSFLLQFIKNKFPTSCDIIKNIPFNT